MRNACCAIALLTANVAAAQNSQHAPGTVVLNVPDCMEVSGAAVKELVALELAPRMQVTDASAAPALTGTVRCSAPVLLIVEDPARVEPLRVELDLAAAAPLARPRLLALTLAELITTSQLEQALPPAIVVEQPDAAQPEPEDERPARAAPRLQLWVAPSFSIAGSPVLPLLGGDVGLSYALGPVLLAFDGQARFARSDRASSDVTLRAFSSGFAVMPLLLDRGAQLAAGAGVRVGHIAMDATAHEPAVTADTISGLWLGPMAVAALHLPFVDAVAMRFALEAGYFARPSVGLDQSGGERIALRGPWLSLGIGVALGPL